MKSTYCKKKKLCLYLPACLFYTSVKGQEISKAIFRETPLPKKQPKFFEGFSALTSKMGQIEEKDKHTFLYLPIRGYIYITIKCFYFF